MNDLATARQKRDRDEAQRLALAYEQGKADGRTEVLKALAKVCAEEGGYLDLEEVEAEDKARIRRVAGGPVPHVTTTYQSNFLMNTYSVSCTCGFSMRDLLPDEAEAKANVHRRL